MSVNSTETSTTRTIDRRVPVLSGRRSYELDSHACNQLIAAGLDPETVAETELSQRAQCFRLYDDQERLIQFVAYPSFV